MKNLKTQEEIIVNWKYDINKPVVSVLCTTYNHESYIEEALEGFLIQETDFPFEIIIHDDASTDNTANIIREYEAKYPKLIKPIYQTKNRFSQGLKNGEVIYPKAKGEYFALCEGDDFWIDKEKLQYQIEIMRAHSECQLSFHPAIFLNTLTMNKTVERRHVEHDKVFSAKEIIQGDGGFCPTASLIIKKEVIQNLPIFFENAPVGDYFLQILGSVKGGALYIDRTMSTYRIQPNGVWTSMVNNFEPLKKFIIKFSETLQEMDSFFDFQYQDEIAFVRNHHFFTFIGNTKFSLLNRIDFYNNYKNHLSLEQQIKQLQILFDEQTRVIIDNKNYYKHNMGTVQEELDSLQHKYQTDIETVQKKLNTITDRYNLMMESISDLIEVPAKRKPLQKISAYNFLTKTYFELERSENIIKPNDFKTAHKINSNITPSEIVFLIPTCAKYSDKTEVVRNTWAKQLAVFGFRYLFLMGKPELKQAEIEGDILYVPCRDDYESLLLKLVLGYEFLYQNMNFTHVYKIDDDCFPNLKQLVKEILPQLADKEYIGGAIHPSGANMSDNWHFGKCSDPKFDQPYKFKVAPFEFAKGGYGYFLRKDILPLLFNLKEEQKSNLARYIYSPEDVRIAEILKEHDILVSFLENYSIISGSDYNNSEHYLVYDIQDPGLMKLIEKQRLEAEEALKNASQVEIVEDKNNVYFIVHPKTDDKKAAFYLYKDDQQIDTQWYSKNMSYTVDKKLHGKGEYKITYFITNENDEDPANNNNKEIGKSKSVTIGSI